MVLSFDAVKKMYLMNIGAVIIVNNDKKITGIFSERDILRRVIPKELDIKNTSIVTVMTKDPNTITSDTSLFDVFNLMQGLNFRHIPVVDNNKLMGIVSIKDIVKVCIKLAKKDR